MVDLEWNRKTVFEKLDWLKETLEDVISKANHNISVYQGQLRAITTRLSALETPKRKSTAATKAKTKKGVRVSAHHAKPSPPLKRKR